MISFAQQKQTLRHRMRDKLKGLSNEHRIQAGTKVRAHMACWFDAHPGIANVSLFKSMPDEISTHEIDAFLILRKIGRAVPHINATKALVFMKLPPHQAIDDNKVCSPTPSTIIDIDSIDVILVPGLAFDKHGHRLGRGQGYYDRALGKPKKKPLLVGLAMDEQIVQHIPTEEHDVVMDYLCTPDLGILQLT
jgi:5-formyltetrahydrofolate cyclo-ligase